MLTTVLSGTHGTLFPARLYSFASSHTYLVFTRRTFYPYFAVSAAITIPLSSVNSRFSAISSRDSVKTVTPSDVTTAVSDVFAL